MNHSRAVLRSSKAVLAVFLVSLFSLIGGVPYYQAPQVARADSGITDFNGDGYADLAIGVREEGAGDNNAGAVNVIYGSPNGGLSATHVPDQLWNKAEICGCEGGDFNFFGTALGIGDFNGDGYADMAVGANQDGVVAPDAGRVYVVYGSSKGLNTTAATDGTGRTPQEWDQESADVEDAAQTLDTFGSSLAVGDFNNDDYDDLAIGVPWEDIGDAYNEDPAAIQDAGAVNVIYGSPDGLSATFVPDQFWHQDVANVEDVVEAGDMFGSSLTAGDFNGDGYSDLTIGVPAEHIGDIGAQFFGPGAVNVIYGSPSGLSATYVPDQFWHQNVAGIEDSTESMDSFGRAIAAGDFNNDGFADLAIGVGREDIGAFGAAGAVNVIYGSSEGLRSTAASDGTGRFDQFWHQNIPNVEDFAEGGDQLGNSLTTGDFNMDGYDDLAVGANFESVGTVLGAGAVNVIYGAAWGLSQTSVPDQIWHQGSPGMEDFPEENFVGFGGEFADHFGESLTAGDFNGDGYYDLAVGVPYETVGSVVRAGAVNVIYGSPTGLSATFVPDQFWHQDSPSIEESPHRSDVFGSAVAATGG